MSDLVGMNVEGVMQAVSHLRQAVVDLKSVVSSLDGRIRHIEWLGNDAREFQSVTWSAHRRRIGELCAGLESAADRLTSNVRAQVATSDAEGTQDAVRLGGLGASRSFGHMDAPGSGRQAVIDALRSTDDQGLVARDEVEIRRLDNGNYVVVMPGVTDLTEVLPVLWKEGPAAALNAWLDDDDDSTTRKMKHQLVEYLTGENSVNPYAERVISQMRMAGVPPGADVMLVGHSFGAFTAMDLAGKPAFNSADGVGAGYSVNVTHVVAAGADTDWQLGAVPASTNVLLLNNKFDAVVAAENPLRADVAPVHPNHLEIWFNNNPTAYLEGAGHDPSNYVEWLGAADRPELNRWFDGVGARYDDGGDRYSVKVPGF